MTDNEQPQLSIIHSKGSLDWAYPTFILASTAAAMDKDVELFFTFYGLKAALKSTDGLKVSPLGNPGMVMHSPVGPDWLRKVDLNRVLPGLLWTLPGMAQLATWGFKKQMLQQGQVPLDELREVCVEMGVKMTVCQMTMELMGYQQADFMSGVDFAGAASYFAQTPQTQSLFV
ncbi:DsrE/DsrF/DrsH-like family protein [Thiomicrorhabdus sediminis]|uniref:Peroxiredoxin family protein n=1 Tax=Thiomicrorhabdus sediminis TaxID=2580412 RepID=A0A4P9K6U7_9GAMM|nr:DsrE/DsrF/DrsH-like family protein [Thiomicrorhabdus sediminis]QCU90601.1 peroxiredoxin family protein [Thiomicrorhabdus sediminis]